MSKQCRISIVVPFYNEALGVSDFANQLLASFPDSAVCAHEFIFVDDGSCDDTLALLNKQAASDARVQVVGLIVNAGHQCALIAGLDTAKGDAVCMMDGDGQHPIPTAKAMIVQWLDNPNIDIIQGIRQGTQGSLFKNITSRAFYHLMASLVPEIRLIPGESDFRVISHRTLSILRQFRDRHRNLRVLLSSLRLPRQNFEYAVEPRRHGSSKYSLRKMCKLAADGVFAFSFLPLRLILSLAAVTALTSAIFLGYAIAMKIRGATVPGWTSTVVCLTALFSALFFILAIIAEYVARIYEEAKSHPPYIRRTD